jgi:hypothetical protein
MDINDRLYVEIHPMEGAHVPHPHPVDEGGFDPACVYKVLGMYNPSETSECYFVLSNPRRQIWFIPQRHLRAFGLIDSDELMLPRETAQALLGQANHAPTFALSSRSDSAAVGAEATRSNGNGNGHSASSGAVGKVSKDWPGRLRDSR